MDEALDDDLFQQFNALVRRRYGIELQKPLLQARLDGRLKSARFLRYQDYYHHLLSPRGEEELTRLLDSLLTHFTDFFREQQHFRFLDEAVIPPLLAHKRETLRNRVRVWCAACSTGEEAYSLAMTFLHQVRDLSKWDLRLLATDVSRQALRIAERGVYPAQRVLKVPPHFRHLYFRPCPEESREPSFKIIRTLRRLVTFIPDNLKDPSPFQSPFDSPFDVIFCRNVMIYFDEPTRSQLACRMAGSLAPGGYFFVGHTESLPGTAPPLAFVRPSIYRKPLQ